MDIFVPSYYNDFKCIANECKHNCCIGWEIDIDLDSLEFYKQHSNIIKNIDLKADTPHFILDKDDRCPFLNKDNLCDIILNHGEKALCQICSDHPRFINCFDTRTEIGLGLTCEAAAKLILDNDFSLVKMGEDTNEFFENTSEDNFFEYRNSLFNKDTEELKNELPDVSLNTVYEVFKKLERLDKNWDCLLQTLKGKNQKLSDIKIVDKEKAKRLLNYFIFRHLYDYGLAFCLICTYVILSIDYDIYETARMFSGEIEYSDENIEKISQNLIA